MSLIQFWNLLESKWQKGIKIVQKSTKVQKKMQKNVINTFVASFLYFILNSHGAKTIFNLLENKYQREIKIVPKNKKVQKNAKKVLITYS